MRLIDIYYKFQKIDISKSKSRRDLVFFSEYYNPIHHQNKNGDSWVYLSTRPDYIKAKKERKCDLGISKGDGSHISCLFFPDPDKPNIAIGDVKNTQDFILAILSENNNVIELFISKGKKNSAQGIFCLYCDNELKDEILRFRQIYSKDAA